MFLLDEENTDKIGQSRVAFFLSERQRERKDRFTVGEQRVNLF